MVTNIIQRFGFAFLLLLAIACNTKTGNSVNQQSPMKDTLVFIGCQEKISVAVGSIVEIKLEAIKGTGYQWILKEPSPLFQQIETDVLKYSTPEGKEEIVGQKSLQVLQFKALEKGKVIIELEYKRTFEKGIEKTCLIEIEIN
jgi:predicted secreted protein